MKKLSIIIVTFFIILAGCSTAKPAETILEKDFKFFSISWGDDWETVQKLDLFKGIETEESTVSDTIIQIQAKGMSFLGNTVDATLNFGDASLENFGLYMVHVLYQEEDEADIIAKMTELYGERKDSISDSNGSRSLIPSGWFTEERVETALTANEKEAFLGMYPNPMWGEARLKEPLVTIQIDEENNYILFSGSDAAVVRYMQR